MNIRASRNGCSSGGMGIRDFSFYYVRIENVEYSEYIFLFAWILFIQWRNITNDIIAPVISQLGGSDHMLKAIARATKGPADSSSRAFHCDQSLLMWAVILFLHSLKDFLSFVYGTKFLS